MADFSQYGTLTDEFIRLQETLPAPPQLSLQELKDTTNDGREKVSKEEMQPLAHQITMTDYQIHARDGAILQARSYRSRTLSDTDKPPLYIHFHGGGFLFGTLDSEDSACARIAIGAPVVVLNVNYRHTPEFTYPTPWHDAEDTYEWAFNNAKTLGFDSQKIIVGGVSAGSWLTSSLAQTKLREQTASSGSFIGQVLMIPCLVHPDLYAGHLKRMKSPELSSYVQNEYAPILPKSRIDMFNSLLFAGQSVSSDDKKLNPGDAIAEQIKGLPPSVFGVAGADPLRDEGLLYAEHLTAQGIPTKVHVFNGVPHGFRRFGAQLSAASTAWDDCITDGIQWILSQPTPTDKVDVIVH